MPTNKLMVHVYLSEKEKKKIEKRAKELGISVSAYIKVKLFVEGKL
ncbi:MAG: ribbon-helix-helix protein, CopG family [Nanoarchaeota archaeon]|nr:ribbon-helix-helix protein, CopG family [Nanoarchaeota archaeon]